MYHIYNTVEYKIKAVLFSIDDVYNYLRNCIDESEFDWFYA
jgi:hypothetical protein